MKLHRSVLLLIAVSVVGCETAADRYRWNVTHAELSPQVRRLPRSDIDQIMHVMAEASQQPVICLHVSAQNPHQIYAITGVPYGDRPDQFGSCVLEKQNGQWRVVHRYLALDPILATGPGCEP